MATSDGVKKQSDQDQSGGDTIDTPGPDNPGNSSTKSGQVGQSSGGEGIPMLEGGKTIYNNLLALEAEAPKISAQDDIKFGNPPAVMSDSAMALSDVNDKFAPKKDIPTIAANNEMTKLPELAQMVDQNGKMQKLPQMFQKLQQVRDVLNFAGGAGGGGGGGGGNGGGGGGGGGSGSGSDYTVGTNADTITSALGNAFCYLATKLGFPLVIQVLFNALRGTYINVMSPDHQVVTKNAVALLLDNAVTYGPDTLDLYKFQSIDYTDRIPPYPLPDYASVPNLYVRVYYNNPNTDPYPGWTQYNAQPPQFVNTEIQASVSGYANTIWVRNPAKANYFYSSATEEMLGSATLMLSAELQPYFLNNTLTAAILDQILGTTTAVVQEQGQNNALGKGSGNNGGNNGNMQQFIQILQQMLQKFQQNDLANTESRSVLNMSKAMTTTQDFTKNMGPLGKIQQLANGAFGSNQFMNLGGINDITGQLSKFGSKGGGGGKNQGSGGNFGQPQSTTPPKGTYAANTTNTTKTNQNVAGLMTALGANSTSSGA
jgi:hypothetical protein